MKLIILLLWKLYSKLFKCDYLLICKYHLSKNKKHDINYAKIKYYNENKVKKIANYLFLNFKGFYLEQCSGDLHKCSYKMLSVWEEIGQNFYTENKINEESF